jgi:hypothetical protein
MDLLQKSSIYFLFLPPQTPPLPTAGLFTHTFQILCSIPPLICDFSFALLNTIKPQQKSNRFFLASALVTGGFLGNEVYRFHIILLFFKISKLITISVYAGIFLVYLLCFLPKIQRTPYHILLSSLSFLLIAILVDFLRLDNYELASLLEGLPKLLSALNLALYFWIVCKTEVIQSYQK